MVSSKLLAQPIRLADIAKAAAIYIGEDVLVNPIDTSDSEAGAWKASVVNKIGHKLVVREIGTDGAIVMDWASRIVDVRQCWPTTSAQIARMRENEATLDTASKMMVAAGLDALA